LSAVDFYQVMLIDTHCHIYLDEFDSDREDMLSRARNEGVSKFIMPAIDSETHVDLLALADKYPASCLPMMGLHPCSVKAEFEKELKIAEAYFDKRTFIAVGETGLDFYWDLTWKKEQYISFQRQIEWAIHYNLPVVIHSRNSLDECIKIISENQKGYLKGVFHCFSGTPEQASKIIHLGFYLGIGGVVTFKNSGIDKVIKNVDLKHIVLETDSPYLAPVPVRGKRNECSYLKYVVERLSSIKGVSKEEIGLITTGNAKELFGI